MGDAKEARMAKPIPDGYHAITPYLIVAGGAKALEFYGRAFGAIERERMQDRAARSVTPRSALAIRA